MDTEVELDQAVTEQDDGTLHGSVNDEKDRLSKKLKTEVEVKSCTEQPGLSNRAMFPSPCFEFVV